MRAGDLDDLRTQRCQELDRLMKALLYSRCIAFATKFADHADLHPGDVCGPGGAHHIGHRLIDGCRIARIMAGDHLVQQSRVQHRTRAGTGLIQTRGQSDQAVARAAAVGGFHADRTRDSRRLPDGAAGIGADGQRGFEGGNCGRRPAAGTTRDPAGVPGIAGWPVRGVLGRGAHREFIEVRLSQDHHVMIKKSPGDRRVVGRQPTFQDLGSTGGRCAGVGEDVLECQRHTCERTDLISSRDLGIDSCRGRQSTLAIHIKESVYLTVDLGDSIKMRLSYLDSTQLA